jgi:RHS repeat-associated protein
LAGGFSWQAELKYNEAGREIERILPGGLTCQWQYDQAGRPAAQKVSRAGVVQSWKKYTWDANNQLENVFDALAQSNTSFKYDALQNLVFAQYADNSIVHRATDATGNIYETPEQNDRRYNAGGALLESDKYFYKYDEEGNLTSKTEKSSQKKTRYAWYANGMLKKVTRHDGKQISFVYDALGRRITKQAAGKITRWVWDNNVPLHEWTYPATEKPKTVINEWGEINYDRQELNPVNASEKVNAITWVFDADSTVPAAKIVNGETYSIVCDHMGTPQWMFDAAGKKTWEGVLDIYGRLRTLLGSKTAMPFRYQGQYEDEETGLYYNRFRYYSPDEGMYLSQDPIGILGGRNLYSYVADPNYYIDIFGLNTGIGNIGEAHVHSALQSSGNYSDFAAIQNNSGHGVDLMAKNATTGEWESIEVKTTQTTKAPSLSKAQGAGANNYTQNRLGRAAAGSGHYKSMPLADRVRAGQILREIRVQGGIKTAHKYEVFLDAHGNVTSTNKKTWKC